MPTVTVGRAGASINPYDGDHDGKLSELEKVCKSYDVSGDGTFSIMEVQKIVQDMQTAEKTAKSYKHLAFGAIFGLVLFAGLFVGLTMAANEASKESHISADGVQQDLDGNAVSVAAATVAAPLSSLLSDEAFTEMKTLHLKGPNSDKDFVNMNVLATARYSNKASRCGTIVVVFTHLGQITLDGTDIYFEERIAHAFTAAGFTTSILEYSNFGGRRRLNAAAMLTGLFNAVADMKEARCVENENPIEGYSGLRDGPLPDLPTGDKWKIKLSSYKECDTTTPAKKEWCLRQPGAAPHPVDFEGKLFFKINRNINMGDAITSATTLSWDATGRTMKSYTKGRDVYNWEDKDGAKYNCHHNVVGMDPEPINFQEAAVYHGDTFTVLGYPARKFTFKTEASGEKPSAIMEVWDRKSDNKLLRLRTSQDPSYVADPPFDPPSTGTNFDDVVELLSLSNSAQSTEQNCVGDVCIAATVPVFGACTNYADRVVSDPSELEGEYEPMLQTPPTVDTDTSPLDDGSVTSPSPFVPDWETCSTAPANVYSEAEGGIIDSTWGTTLNQAKSRCYADALCTGFSHNYNDMTYFYNTAALSTCTSAAGVVKAGAIGSYITYGKVPAARRLQTEEDRRKLGYTRKTVIDLGGAEITYAIGSSGLSSLDVCSARRRLDEAAVDEAIDNPKDNRTATERRLAFIGFKAGWGGCVKFSSGPYSVDGCISYDVKGFGHDLFTAEGCIGIFYCSGRTGVQFQLNVNIGDGWWFGGTMGAKLRAIVSGGGGGCIKNGAFVDFGIGMGITIFGNDYTHNLGPWTIGGRRRQLADGTYEDPEDLDDLAHKANVAGFGSIVNKRTLDAVEKMAQNMAGQ
jgi:hypothetical protein